MPTYKAPQEVKRLVQRAIDQNLSLPISRRAAYKTENNKRVPGTGMQTARMIVNDRVDEKRLRVMSAWFARHGDNPLEKEARRASNSKAAIAWALWGGNAGRRWVAATLRDIERKK